MYTNTVIRQLISTHRGVAPSQGIDLDPIMRHCLRARKMRLIRDILFVVLLAIGEYLVPFQTGLFLLICYFVGFLPSVNWARSRTDSRSSPSWPRYCLDLASLVPSPSPWSRRSLARWRRGRQVEQADRFAAPAELKLSSPVALLVLGGIAAVQLVYWYRWPGPNAMSCPLAERRIAGAALNHEIEARIAHVRAAQYGNLVLYGDRNPFLGTGHNPFDELSRAKFFGGLDTGKAWSIAIELLRENGGRGLLPGLSNSRVTCRSTR